MKKLLQDMFRDSKFFKTLFFIALPIVIQNFIASSLNMVDTIMIGRVGETEIASVGIANQYFFLLNIILVGTYGGCGIFFSQFWGKKDIKNIRKVLGIGAMLGGSIALVFTFLALLMPGKIISIFNSDPIVIDLGAKYLKIVCISYIFTALSFNFAVASRCIENTVLPMITSIIALLINTLLNYVLIFGKFGAPAMGVEGAAIATLIARLFETSLLIGYIYFSKGVLAATFKEMFNLKGHFVKSTLRTIIPVILNDACWGLGAVIYSVAYGRIGTQAIASVQICTTIQNLFMVVTFGIANASVVMIGNKIGEGNEGTARIYADRFAVLSCIIGAMLGVLLYFFAPAILIFFKVSNDVLHSSLIILYITSIIMIVRVFNVVLIVGILRSGGDAKYALLAEAFTMWCIGVPLAFIGAFLLKLPVYYVVAMVTAEEIVKFFIALNRLKSNKWMRNLVHNI